MKHLSRLFLFARLQPVSPFLATAQNRGLSETLVFERYSNQWFEGAMMPVSISPDGKWAIEALKPR